MIIRTAPFAASLRRLIDAFALAGLSGATMLMLGMLAGRAFRRISKIGPADRLRSGPNLEPAHARVKATRPHEIRWPGRARARRMAAGPRPMQQATAKLAA